MRLRFHKILNEGRSVRFEKREEETLELNLIVFRDQKPVRVKRD